MNAVKHVSITIQDDFLERQTRAQPIGPGPRSTRACRKPTLVRLNNWTGWSDVLG
jgi:hypothetical protein